MAEVRGYKLVCPICRRMDFDTRYTLLNSKGLTFLNLEWLNQEAKNYICKNCGYILWFIDNGEAFAENLEKEVRLGNEPMVIDYETSAPEANECPMCFSKRTGKEKECSNCGYVFQQG